MDTSNGANMDITVYIVCNSTKILSQSNKGYDFKKKNKQLKDSISKRGPKVCKGLCTMLNRYGMDRFKKAESIEPFSVNPGVLKQAPSQPQPQLWQPLPTEAQVAVTSSTSLGQGGSNWQPPEWAVEFKNRTHVLEVVKDGTVVDKILLEKKRALFGRQAIMCDYVLDHPSVSRQHAVVVQHKNGSVYVIDLGSVHGTFVVNERLNKDNPVELEVGQSLKFAASTRTYVLRKIVPDPTTTSMEVPKKFIHPPTPDANNEEAVMVFNTSLNKLGVPNPNSIPAFTYQMHKRNASIDKIARGEEKVFERLGKRARKSKVSFRDEYGGILTEVVGISDGADVSTEPGPIGVKEGSLVGKYESLVHVTVIPKGQDDLKEKVLGRAIPGVTQRLQEYLDKVKSPNKSGLYEDLYGDLVSGLVGDSWAGSPQRYLDGVNSNGEGRKNKEATIPYRRNLEKDQMNRNFVPRTRHDLTNDDNDDLFGDVEDRSIIVAPVVLKS